MSDPVKCPNCVDMIRFPKYGCVLESLVRVLIDRGHDPFRAMKLLETAELDGFWEKIEPIIDDLERDLEAMDE